MYLRYLLNHSFIIISYMVNTDVKMRSEETKAYMEASHGNPTVQLPKYLYLRSTPQRWMLDNL